MGRIFGFFGFWLGIWRFSQTKGLVDSVWVLITQGLFSHVVLTSLFDLVSRILTNYWLRGCILARIDYTRNIIVYSQAIFHYTGAKQCHIMGGNHMGFCFVVSRFVCGSAFHLGTPRRRARVKVSSFDVRTTLSPRKPFGERLHVAKVYNYGSDFLIFDVCLGISSFLTQTDPPIPCMF